MVLIKVQYDAYNRQFTPLEGQSLKRLEDGETYILMADVSLQDLNPTEIVSDIRAREEFTAEIHL